jgi:hypothetical protein
MHGMYNTKFKTACFKEKTEINNASYISKQNNPLYDM